MDKNEEVECWLEISGAMLRGLLPKGSGIEVFGIGMPAVEFAALVDSEMSRVDHALVAMATASGENEVKHLFAQLTKQTQTALFARWAHYSKEWGALIHDPNPPLWMPSRDTWRAVFLSMTTEGLHSTDAARSLWPEEF